MARTHPFELGGRRVCEPIFQRALKHLESRTRNLIFRRSVRILFSESPSPGILLIASSGRGVPTRPQPVFFASKCPTMNDEADDFETGVEASAAAPRATTLKAPERIVLIS